MLKCPKCGCLKTYITGNDYAYNCIHKDYKRYRRCAECGFTFGTREVWIQEPRKFSWESREE